MNKYFQLVFIAALFFTLNAHAIFFIEPMVSYEMGSSKIEFTSAGTAMSGATSLTTANTATNYGMRLGYVFGSGYWLAGTYSGASTGISKLTTSEWTYNREVTGADIGMMSGRWNLWLGYNFSDKYVFKHTLNAGNDYGIGSSMKIGIGYWIYDHIVFYVEHIQRVYTAGQQDGADALYTDYKSNIMSFNQQCTNVGLSFPF